MPFCLYSSNTKYGGGTASSPVMQRRRELYEMREIEKRSPMPSIGLKMCGAEVAEWCSLHGILTCRRAWHIAM